MSAEVAKKRGRPKKVISDPIEIELPEKKKSSTRAKSTKATPKPAKASSVAAKKTETTTTASQPATSPPPAAKPVLGPTAPNAAVPTKPESKAPAQAPSKPASKPPVTLETSKILEKVRGLSAKGAPAPQDSLKSSKLSPSTSSYEAPAPTSKASWASSKPKTPPSTTTPVSVKSPSTSKPSQIPPTVLKPPPKIPIAALNSEIVSNISSRAGAKPNTGDSRQLGQAYKSVARKVTYAIVAMPILLVTSWVLYERLVLGEDRKLLVKPGLAKVDTTGEETRGTSGSSVQS